MNDQFKFHNLIHMLPQIANEMNNFNYSSYFYNKSRILADHTNDFKNKLISLIGLGVNATRV